MKEIITKNLKPVLLILAVVFGILLIYLSDSTAEDGEATAGTSFAELDLYARNLEKKLEGIIEHIDGVGDAAVMITLKSSFEKVYASDARVQENGADLNAFAGKTTEKQMVLAGSGTSGEAPVLLKELCPRVEGVAVICSGASDENIERKIKDAAVSLFGISELKVYVARGNHANNGE